MDARTLSKVPGLNRGWGQIKEAEVLALILLGTC